LTTYADCNTTEDAAITADTETLLADLTIPSGKGGTIKKIRVSMGNVTNAKGSSGFLEVKLGSHEGPYRFPIFKGEGAATIGKIGDAEEIDVDIPVFANETVKVYVTMAEAMVSGFAGIVWVA